MHSVGPRCGTWTNWQLLLLKLQTSRRVISSSHPFVPDNFGEGRVPYASLHGLRIETEDLICNIAGPRQYLKQGICQAQPDHMRDRSIAKYVGSGCSRGVVIRAARQPHGVSGAGYVKTVIQSPNINTTQTNHATRGEYYYFNPYTYIWGSQNQFSTLILILICLQDLLKLLFSTCPQCRSSTTPRSTLTEE